MNSRLTVDSFNSELFALGPRNIGSMCAMAKVTAPRHQGLAVLNTHSSGSRRVWRRHLLHCTIPSLRNSLRTSILYISHMLFHFLVTSSPSLQMLHDGSLLNMDHLHRANAPAFSFSQQTGEAGWHMFLPLAIALHTLDRQEWRERWKKKWVNPFVANAASKYCTQSGFKVRSRHFWPYPTSQHQRCRKKK